MLHTVTSRALVVAACGWLLAGNATALSLGRASGAVLVGRPLELTIAATLDTAETDPCGNADLFYGEHKVARPPRVRWESRDGKEGVLRVSSEVPIDEPMVTLYLRVGCGQPSSRRYVLLAELPPEETPAPAARSARSAQATAPVVPSAPAAAPAPSVARRPVAVARPKAERARPVLKLEPLDLSIDYSPSLRMSTEIGTQPTADPQKRQEAAALWQALQKAPEERMQEAQRLQAVQRDLQSVREETRQNAAAVVEMRTEVEKARTERNIAALLVVALAAVFAALLGVLGWRWYRVHRVERISRWFEANGMSSAAVRAAAAPGAPEVDLALDGDPVEPPVVDTSPMALAPMGAGSTQRAPAVVPAAPSGESSRHDFQPSRGASIRMVGVEELLDVHDKADFFLSIGEVNQAVAVLEAHVHDQVETSALPWMDLLELYHSLGRRTDFDRLRAEFGQRFSAHVPDFEHFEEPTPTLEDYSRAFSRIVALWPTRRVLDVIEESIFRKPGWPGAEPFSLEAYRELVLLYHVAKDVSPVEDVTPKTPRITSFSDTSLQPLHTLDAPDRPAPDVDLLQVPPSSPNVGVDIDVTAPEEEEPETVPPLDFDVDSTQDDLPGPGRGRG